MQAIKAALCDPRSPSLEYILAFLLNVNSDSELYRKTILFSNEFFIGFPLSLSLLFPMRIKIYSDSQSSEPFEAKNSSNVERNEPEGKRRARDAPGR
jgi:hypothetical protein